MLQRPSGTDRAEQPWDIELPSTWLCRATDLSADTMATISSSRHPEYLAVKALYEAWM
jgi:hypothetical protein